MNSKNQIRTIGKKVTINRNVSTKLSDVAKSATSSIKHQGTPNDAVFLKPIRFGCDQCIKTGTPKVYKNLWKLYLHFKKDHGFTKSQQYLLETLANLIERKVIL